MKSRNLKQKVSFLFIGAVMAFANQGQATENVSQNPATATPAAATQTSGFVKMDTGHAVAYEYSDAGSDAPIVVTLTGLIYPLQNLQEFADGLAAKKISSLRIAFSTQGESIRKINQSEKPYFMEALNPLSPASTYLVTEDSLVEDVVAVIKSLPLKNRKLYLATLSYSGYISEALLNKHGDLFQGHLMYSPGMKPSHRYDPKGEQSHQAFVASLSFWSWNPFMTATIDKNYDISIQTTMFNVMSPKKDVPGYVPDDVTFDQFFAGIFCLARAVKYTDLTESEETHSVRTRLVLASKEDPPMLKDQIRYFFKSEATQEMFLVQDAYHGIPGAHAPIAVQLLEDFIKSSPPADKAGFVINLDGTKKSTLQIQDIRDLEASL